MTRSYSLDRVLYYARNPSTDEDKIFANFLRRINEVENTGICLKGYCDYERTGVLINIFIRIYRVKQEIARLQTRREFELKQNVKTECSRVKYSSNITRASVSTDVMLDHNTPSS